jgi:HSP20 family protein
MTTEKVATKQASERTDVEHTRNGRFYSPNVDILEQVDELLVLADLPGARNDQIDINFEKGELTLHASVPARQTQNQQYLVREYGIGDYYRTFRVSEAIDAGRISAEFANGVLTLHLPKAESIKPRKINVTAK